MLRRGFFFSFSFSSYSPLFKKSLIKATSCGGLNRRSNQLQSLQGKSTVTGVILLLHLEVDIIVVFYCYLDILAQ